MATELGDWLRIAKIEPNPETLPKHDAAIQEYGPSAAQIVSLDRVFYRFAKNGDPFLHEFRSIFQAKDPTFPMRDNMQLMAVLAGAALIETIRHSEDQRFADFAALCLVSAAAQGLRTDLPVPEMAEIAARYLEGRTKARTMRSTENEKEDANSQVERLKSELAIVSEETNMLWWLMSDSSRDRKETWMKIKLPASAILAGKELADLTRVIPGPVAALAFLDKIMRICNAGKSPKDVNVKEAIEKTPREWREHKMTDLLTDGLKDLLPITNAVKLSLTVDDGGDWTAVFEKGTAISHVSKLPPSTLAYQVFLERMVSIQEKQLSES